ncbi:MAG: hypothetical protein LUE22_00870 [Oscillospiraceae bacterium]|nr:hypothetical protein [Oscillospiraceae bacterium]
MSKVKVKLNSAGVRELLRGSEMQSVLAGHASDIMGRLPDGYEQSTAVGTNRCYARVTTASYAAMQRELNNKTLLKAVGGG